MTSPISKTTSEVSESDGTRTVLRIYTQVVFSVQERLEECEVFPDVEYTTDDRLTDDDIRQYLRGHWHLEHPTDLQKKEKADCNETLIEAIQYGAPLRQLSD